MSGALRVLIVDDQLLVRSGFAMILSVEDDVEVVGEAADGEAAITQARLHRPDVVLMDVQMPGMDGIEATRQIVAEDLGRVIILTTFDRDDYLFDALEAGASGFLLKNSDPDTLVEAVRAAAGGHALLAPEVTRRVIARMTPRPGGGSAARRPADETAPTSTLPAPPAQPAQPAPPRPEAAEVARLTEREREVVLLVGEGLSNAEIAARLFVGEATVKTHVSSCLAKLHLRDRVQAVVWAHRAGLIPRAE